VHIPRHHLHHAPDPPEQGGVSVNGEKVTDVKTQYAGEDLQGEGITLKRGKKSFKKIVMA